MHSMIYLASVESRGKPNLDTNSLHTEFLMCAVLKTGERLKSDLTLNLTQVLTSLKLKAYCVPVYETPAFTS